MISVLDSLQVGDITLPNRVMMAPLTRLHGTPDNLPTQIMIEYYTQRADAGLIISEGISVVPQGIGYANVPGIWSPQQVEAWKPITSSVHHATEHGMSERRACQLANQLRGTQRHQPTQREFAKGIACAIRALARTLQHHQATLVAG